MPRRDANPAGTPASYGPTQFVVSTFVDRLLTFSDVRKPSTNKNLAYRVLFDSQASMTDEERLQLGFVDAQGQDSGLRQRLDQAAWRAINVVGGIYAGKYVRGWRVRLNANTPISPPDADELQRFAAETGFSHSPGSASSEAYTVYVKMVKWAQMGELMGRFLVDGGGDPDAAYSLLHQRSLAQTQARVSPTAEQRFDSLLIDLGMTRRGFRPYLRQRIWNEGWQGFATAAVFIDPVVRAALLKSTDALFKSREKFSLISDRELRWKYAAYRIHHPDESELDIVARVGYFHNAGSDIGDLFAARSFGYSKGLMSIWGDTKQVPCARMAVSRLSLDPGRKSGTK